MRRLLVAVSVAGSLLAVESLAIHQPPVLSSFSRGEGNFRRRRSPPCKSESRSFSLASSQSQESQTTKAANDDSGASTHVGSHSPVKHVNNESAALSIWPRGDELDKRMIKIALPCIANFAINPLVGAVDLFWVNRMSNALAVAGQAAANQVFSSAFWVVSVLPSVTATLVSKANASGNQDEVQNAVSQALIVGFGISILGSILMLRFPEKVLSSVLKEGAPALQYARPYLFIRSFAFLPSLISLIGFSAFRGIPIQLYPSLSICCLPQQMLTYFIKLPSL